MVLDLERLKTLVSDLEVETSEAVSAKAELESKNAASLAAADALSLAVGVYTRENEERLAKMREIMSELQAALEEG